MSSEKKSSTNTVQLSNHAYIPYASSHSSSRSSSQNRRRMIFQTSTEHQRPRPAVLNKDYKKNNFHSLSHSFIRVISLFISLLIPKNQYTKLPYLPHNDFHPPLHI